ncbi:hypothetical protein Hanom_Chr12g01176411 [Helianthus anomalus]
MASQHNEALLDAQSTFQQGQLRRDAPSGQQEGVLNQVLYSEMDLYINLLRKSISYNMP